MQIASANKKEQEVEIETIKKYSLRIRQVKHCCKKSLVKHIFNHECNHVVFQTKLPQHITQKYLHLSEDIMHLYLHHVADCSSKELDLSI